MRMHNLNFLKETTSFSLLVYLAALMAGLALAACSTVILEPEEVDQATETTNANQPDPASVFCEEQGFQLEIRTKEDGSQTAFCIFPDGSECDEWAYYRGECGPAGQDTKDGNGEGEPNLPNEASVYCKEQGYQSEIRTAADGSQAGVCIFEDGSECDEWAYYRGACGPASGDQTDPTGNEGSGPITFTAADYTGWWKYTHPTYPFSILLPDDWKVEADFPNDPLLNGHLLVLRPSDSQNQESIRMTFRQVGEETLLWPTGAGQGEFVQQERIMVAGQAAARVAFVCPNGKATALYYQQGEGQANITRGNMEFGFIYYAGQTACAFGFNLDGSQQLVGDKIVTSLEIP